MKKPTENFDQKPVQNPVEGNSDDFQEKVESDEKDTVSKEMEQEQASKELVDSEVHEQGEAGMITPEDLQKIELIIEDFKKQYGSNWDSSKIEADLKMVLERQRLTGPAEKTIKEGNAPLPGRYVERKSIIINETPLKHAYSLFLFSLIINTLRNINPSLYTIGDSKGDFFTCTPHVSTLSFAGWRRPWLIEFHNII